MIDWIFLSMLLAASLLMYFRAPTYRLWLLAVAVTGFSWVPLLLSLVIWVIVIKTGHHSILIQVAAGIGVFSYAVPFVSARGRSVKLKRELSEIFPCKERPGMQQRPFRFWKIFAWPRKRSHFAEQLVYKTMAAMPLSLAFYRSAAPGFSPLVVVVHGGSWLKGDNTQLPELNGYLARKGYHVAAINYRLAPKNQYPAPVEDTLDAIHYLLDRSDILGVDKNRIVLLGRSAGGQIALMAAYSRQIPGLKGVIAYYTPADMVWGASSRFNKRVLDIDYIFRCYLGVTYREAPGRYQESSPCAQVREDCPATLIIHGRIDALVAFEHSIRLKRLLDRSRVKNYFLKLPFATHGFDYSLRGPDGQMALYTVERFLQSVLS